MERDRVEQQWRGLIARMDEQQPVNMDDDVHVHVAVASHVHARVTAVSSRHVC